MVGYSTISRETPSIALPMTLRDIFLAATANYSLDNTVVAGKNSVAFPNMNSLLCLAGGVSVLVP
jgi:hypothetical protein